MPGIPMPTPRELTPRQQRFVDEYLIDLNATQAAIRAGYSEKTARSIGCENLTKPDVVAAIDAKRSAQSERLGITQDYVLGRLRDNLERSLQAEPVLDREGKQTGEYSYQGSVANRAAELLGKHLGMFSETPAAQTTNIYVVQAAPRFEHAADWMRHYAKT
jgi:phage terminase small subunit